MILRFFIILCAVIGAGAKSLLAASDWPDVVMGESYRVVDGDTIHLEGKKIRLLGIDAPEMKQSCRAAEGESWACGVKARDVLKSMLAHHHQVSCKIDGRDRYGRLLGRCFAGQIDSGVDVQKALVAQGIAVAEYTNDYRRDERHARHQKNGIWAGQFLRPKQYRKNRRQ